MPGDTMPLRRSLEIQRGGACYIDFAPNGAGGQAAVPQSAVAAEAMADRTKRVRAVYHLDTGEALAKVDSTVCPPRAPRPTPPVCPFPCLRCVPWLILPGVPAAPSVLSAKVYLFVPFVRFVGQPPLPHFPPKIPASVTFYTTRQILSWKPSAHNLVRPWLP